MPKRKVVFRPHAVADLEALNDYIVGNSGVRRADAFVGRIREVCLALEKFPFRGRPRPELAEGIRTVAVDGRALIAYRVGDTEITIVRVFYAGLDYAEADFGA